MKNKTNDDFIRLAHALALQIESSKSSLINLLLTYETYSTAQDEIDRTIKTLTGFKKEFTGLNRPDEMLKVATFFPLNLPLYSLVLFAVAPSFFSNAVYVRPPEIMHSLLNSIFSLLDIVKLYPDISLMALPRNLFVELYAQEADVIIFTGKYQNALKIRGKCPDALLVYNGSGINPIILFENGDVDLAIEKTVKMRIFNSGQDCAGPDAIFIPSDKADQFSGGLKKRLSTLKVGSTSNKNVDVGPLMKRTYAVELKKWLDRHSSSIIYGGKVSSDEGLVQPTIVRRKLKDQLDEDYHEFFAPVFYLLEYANPGELMNGLQNKKFTERGMYVSIFGQNKTIENKLDFVQIIRDKIVNDIEIGNYEYGGYGPKANFLWYKNDLRVQPILISRDITSVLC